MIEYTLLSRINTVESELLQIKDELRALRRELILLKTHGVTYSVDYTDY